MYSCEVDIVENTDGSTTVTTQLCPRASRILKYKQGKLSEIFEGDVKSKLQGDSEAITRIAMSKVFEGKYEVPSTRKEDLLDFELDRDEAKLATLSDQI
jgi:hypothetical protein